MQKDNKENKDNFGQQLNEARRHKQANYSNDLKLDKDQDLLVIEDMDNGNEYFFYQLDAFSLDSVDYVCLASYEPDVGNVTEPDLVLMHTYLAADGSRRFSSIRDEAELEKVFDVFYNRIESNLQK